MASTAAAENIPCAITVGKPNSRAPIASVYSVTDFGLGFSNVYVATPDDTGDAAGSIQDFLVTPFGNVDLSSMFASFDAIAAFDPADAVAGVTDVMADGAFNIFDPGTWF